MAKHKYTVATEDAALYCSRDHGVPSEVGDEVELDLSVDQARAVVAAGWLEPVEEKTTKKKEEAK